MQNTPPSPCRGRLYYLTVGAPSSGGQWVNEEHVEALNYLGWDAMLLQWPRGGKERWPAWNTACRVMHFEDLDQLRSIDTVVIPEGWREKIDALAATPARKIIHCQNPYYGLRGAPDMKRLLDKGVTDIISCSAYTSAFIRRMGWSGPLHVVHPQLDAAFIEESGLCRQGTRKPSIAYMPRKRTIEAMFMPALFRTLYPQWQHVPWIALADMSRSECATHLKSAAVFASFSHLEGLGLPPLEAASCGCIVAGFTGGGGQDYATPANGFWVAEGDHEGYAQALDTALRCAIQPTWRSEVLSAFEPALLRHRRASFLESLESVWATIIPEHRSGPC
jgi:Glycosyl transferases group 1